MNTDRIDGSILISPEDHLVDEVKAVLDTIPSSHQNGFLSLVYDEGELVYHYTAALTGQAAAVYPTAIRAFTRTYQHAVTGDKTPLRVQLYRASTQECLVVERGRYPEGLLGQAWYLFDYHLQRSRKSGPITVSVSDPEVIQQVAATALPFQFRAALLLGGVTGFSYKDQAEVLEIDQARIKPLVYHARVAYQRLVDTARVQPIYI